MCMRTLARALMYAARLLMCVSGGIRKLMSAYMQMWKRDFVVCANHVEQWRFVVYS